ncbi:HIT family protein [Lentzea sp. NPDC054927]
MSRSHTYRRARQENLIGARSPWDHETVVVFMDLNPVTPGHLLVVPREHVVGLEDLDAATSAHVWSAGHDMARALRRSNMGCEGINAPQRERSLLDRDAQAVKDAIASTD